MNRLINNKYRVIQELGKDKGVKILLGEFDDSEGNRRVVIKEKTTEQEGLDEIFSQQESKIISNLLAHQNNGNSCEKVLKILEVFKEGDKEYIISEYYSSRNLSSLIDSYHSEIGLEYIIKMAIEIINGIEYLHSIGITIYNLNAETILIKRVNGELKPILTEFASTQVQHLQFCIQQINHLAPEILQMTSHEQQVDIWSFGCLLFEMVYRNTLFYGESSEEIVRVINTFKEYNFNEERPAYKIINKIIQKCVQVELNKRITPDQISQKLQKCLKVITDQHNLESKLKESKPDKNKEIDISFIEPVQKKQIQLNDEQFDQEIPKLQNLNTHKSVMNYLLTMYLQVNLEKNVVLKNFQVCKNKLLVTPQQILEQKASKDPERSLITTTILLLYSIFDDDINQPNFIQHLINSELLNQEQMCSLIYLLVQCKLIENDNIKLNQFFMFLKNNTIQESIKLISTLKLQPSEKQLALVEERMQLYNLDQKYLLSATVVQNIKDNIINFFKFILLVVFSNKKSKSKHSNKHSHPIHTLDEDYDKKHKIINPFILILRYLMLVIATVLTSIILLAVCLSFETIVFLFKLIIFDFQLIRYIIEIIKQFFVKKINNSFIIQFE